MTCEDAKTRGAGKALGELEEAERADVERHLAACAGCRSEFERDERTVAALRSLDPVEGSEERRERAVAAMVAARAPRITRRRWVAASIAAGVLAVLAVPLLLPRRGMIVERLDGVAAVLRNGEALKIGPGFRLESGDQIETQGVVALQGPDRLKVLVHRDSKIVYVLGDGAARFRVLDGAVRVDAPDKTVALEDPLGRLFTVSGTCEARFKKVAGWPKPEKKTEIQIHVKKGEARFKGRAIGDGQTMTVTEEGTVTVDDPGRDSQ